MNTAQDLARRLREVWLEGTWIAHTNVRDQITSLSHKQATSTVENRNTLAALTFHLHYYMQGVLRVLEGGVLDIHDRYSWDMPPIQSEADWQNRVEAFIRDAGRFVACVETLDESRLDAVFVKEEYGTVRRNIEAQIEHSYYHLGQMSLIRKSIQGDRMKNPFREDTLAPT